MILPVITLWVANINLLQSALRSSSGSLTMLSAIRRASSRANPPILVRSVIFFCDDLCNCTYR
jgi:hypothetical protein